MMPLHFNQSQRQAIKNAGALAGLNVVRSIAGSTAASIGYGFEKTGLRAILVFDMGGSALDLSLVTIDDDIYEVLATLGVPHLGGVPFKRTHGKDLRTNSRAMVRLRSACEQAKRAVSTSTEAQIELESLYEGIDLNSTISRPRFNDLCADLFDKALGAVSKVLRDAKKSKTRVDEIVLVGGSPRIPRMQQLLEDFFNGKKRSPRRPAQQCKLPSSLVAMRHRSWKIYCCWMY
ncbi:hypothetical protein PHYSODRAFT_249932 [Phytophthora sojae]|uniref:Heat shock protein 70 n=1 Tax=Phytophthora sojae (strain P6497) TaxID=1094619 RepID=G5A5D1_PHYSP|nr:hypothetical protein PHYSODRAFT_249932 [Phytophthora sojae]EGZ09315.1 hypothetical protein PHYSODRAFT_249932 [Phytophthora sojae]|eukprot:XP_009535948.1 hypothetical protein PHYSODRAFT_249932 [Phytophthora sojae]